MQDSIHTMGNELSELCQWASNIQFNDLSGDVIQRAKWVLLDDLGAIMAGSLEPEVKSLTRTYLDMNNDGSATILAKGFPMTNHFTAAELNGIAGCSIELDEGYRLATSHAGIYTIPALLAWAEIHQTPMSEVLTALVVGYEFAARFAETWVFPPLVIHPHGVFVTIAAAAACAKVNKVNAKSMFDVITTASALTIASPYDHAVKGALVRNLWTGVGARLGMLATEVQKDQVFGLESSPHTVFSTIYHGNYQQGVLNRKLGQKFAISYGYHKAYACCQYAHSALDALLEIRERYTKDNKVEIPKKITVKTHPKGLSLNQVHPMTTLGSKFSMPHAIAAAWVTGTGGRKAFVKETLTDPIISGLREKIVLEPIEELGPPPNDRPAKVIVHFENGRTDEEYSPFATGDPSKPFDENILRSKFIDTVSGVLNKPNEVADAVLGLDTKLKVNELIQMIKDKEKEK